jgi:hypothetical protein
MVAEGKAHPEPAKDMLLRDFVFGTKGEILRWCSVIVTTQGNCDPRR